MANDRRRDYVRIAIEYADDAIADKAGRKHNKRIRQAARRFKDDLKRATKKSCNFVFNDWHACDACDFIEKLPHIEGVWSKPEIELHPAQIFFLVQLFGFRLRGDLDRRRFTTALYATARKAAKSTLGAGIMLYCFCCEEEPGAQLYSAATTYDQAKIIWSIAKAMVEKTPELSEEFGLETWSKSISQFATSSSFKPLHAKASTQDGLNPSHIALDEIHAHKTADLFNVLTSAAGSRRNPLWLFTTTEGYLNPGPWGEIRTFAFNLLDGVFGTAADHYLALFFALDDEDADFDETKWVKANPLLESSPILMEKMRELALEAKQMPSKLAEFQIKRLNRQASTSKGWINLAKWKQCEGRITLETLRDHPCYGGLDLASTTDLASFRLLWDVDGTYYTIGWRWVPEEAVKRRTERRTVPYAAWVEKKLIELTPGDCTDYSVIEKRIKSVREAFNVKQIAYDPWNATDLCNRLIDAGLPMVQFRQGTKSYHPAMQALELHYMSGRFVYDNDPVLTWCASNLTVRLDDNMNMAPDKKRSPEKIDDMTALLMAVGVSQVQAPPEPEYQMFIVG